MNKTVTCDAIDIDPHYGVSLKDMSWVPAPRYVLRRSRLLSLIRKLEPGKALEIGCGAGGITFDLTQRNFDCVALESSAQAKATASRIFSNADKPVALLESPEAWEEEFDYLLSFEVLEHIEHDREALDEWVKWIKPGGYLLLSVPARMSMWGPIDVWAGHHRRYEKEQLRSLLEDAQLDCVHFENYGFPLSNFTTLVKNFFLSRKKEEMENKSKQQNTDRSGVERKTEARFYKFQRSLLGRILILLACKVQVLFSNIDYGDGYIVLARKRSQ